MFDFTPEEVVKYLFASGLFFTITGTIVFAQAKKLGDSLAGVTMLSLGINMSVVFGYRLVLIVAEAIKTM